MKTILYTLLLTLLMTGCINVEEHVAHNLQYIKTEPENDWLTYDVAYFKSDEGAIVKFLIHTETLKIMNEGTKYDVYYLMNDISLPANYKITKAIPVI